jgi:CheY-like chemotaxis protein
VSNAIPLSNTNHLPMNLERPQKPKMLVVDDEPDNLDLLYRTFRRDFQVLRAESGVAALDVLKTEGEVAVIISDQRMPEMKGTEFLSKTVPQFPNTMRIILTGFTDVEDLVEAINSGQVYKYITKPWDPGELKAVVQRAAETYELLKQRTEELRQARSQATLLNTIIQIANVTSRPEDCLKSIATAIGEALATDQCILQLCQNGILADAQGLYGDAYLKDWLRQDPLVEEAIASSSAQMVYDIASDPSLSLLHHYKKAGVQAHLLFPIRFHNQLLAVLSLQWQQPYALREDELTLLNLATQQIALALICADSTPVNLRHPSS